MAEQSHLVTVTDIVGAVASVVGLGLTLYLLRIAQDVKNAVERAREDTLSTIKKRSLVEDLEDVRRMIQQVGNLIQQEEWLAVHMRTEEIVGTCKAAMARWGDGLPNKAKDGVGAAGSLLQSVAAKSSEYGDRALTAAEKNKLIRVKPTSQRLTHFTPNSLHKNE